MFFAIPFYKNSDFLKDTIQSLVAQTDPAWSAVVLDDSVEASEAERAKLLVEGFQDSRIRYQKNPQNIGMGKNWNQGLELAKNHELAVLLHADDRLKPDYVFEMKKFAREYPDAVAYFCRADIIGADGTPAFSFADFYKKLLLPKEKAIVLSGNTGVRALIPGNYVFCPSICYRMPKIASERFSETLKMVTDFDFIMRLLLRGEKLVGYYDHALFEYRRHENTTQILTRNLTRFHEEIWLYREIAEKLLQKGETETSAMAKQMKVVKLNLLFQIVKSCLTFRFKAMAAEFKLLREIAS